MPFALLRGMAQDLPRTSSLAPTLQQSSSEVRKVTLEPSLRPPKPELPNKWHEKRRQVWSATRLLQADEVTTRDAQAPLDTLATNSLPPERTDAGPVWVELRDDEISSIESVGGNESKRPPHVSSIRIARGLLRGNAELSHGTNALSLPIGLFVAGAGLLIASALELFVILPALFVRRGLVRFSNWAIRQSPVVKRIRPHLAPS